MEPQILCGHRLSNAAAGQGGGIMLTDTERAFSHFLHMPLQLLELWNFLGIMEFTYITGNLMKWTVLNTGGNRV